MAARYPHRGHRPELSRATQRLAFPVFAGTRMPFGTARRDARFPGAAVPLGQGPHTGCQETFAHHLSRQASAAPQSRSLPAPDAEYLLSPDDRDFGFAAAGHDRALLHGSLPNAVHRPAPYRGLVLVDFAVLLGGASRALSQGME